jgi:hypothetical protein
MRERYVKPEGSPLCLVHSRHLMLLNSLSATLNAILPTHFVSGRMQGSIRADVKQTSGFTSIS